MREASRPEKGRGTIGYSGLQIALHWAIAALVLVQLTLNDAVRLAFHHRLGAGPSGAGQGAAAPEGLLFGLEAGALAHLGFGLSVLGLTLLRLGLRVARGPVPPPEGAPDLLKTVAEWAHRGLYLLLFFTALTGAWAWFGRSETAAALHELGRMSIVMLIIAHVIGALVEHFFIGTRVIHRMIDSGHEGDPLPAPESRTGS